MLYCPSLSLAAAEGLVGWFVACIVLGDGGMTGWAVSSSSSVIESVHRNTTSLIFSYPNSFVCFDSLTI